MGRNHKARFRGDIQVDGSILGPDGQPIGGGAVDWAVPIPELHFAGDPSDSDSGMNIAWDEDYYGLVIQGNPGSGAADLYLVNNPDSGGQLYAHPGGLILNDDVGNGSAMSASAFGAYGPNGHVMAQQDVIEMAVATSLLRLTPTDFQESSGHLGLSMHYDSSQGVANPTFIRTVAPYSDTDHFAIHLDGSIHWGGGSAAPDVTLKRSGVGWLVLESEGTSLELDVSGNASIFVLDNEDDWIDYAEYGYKGWQVNYDTGMSHLKVNAGRPQFWMSDAHGGVSWTTQQQYFSYATDDPTHQFLAFQIYTDNHPRFKLDQNGRQGWGPGGDNGEDTHLKRRAAGVLELEENGGGLVLHSPDGTAYKISVANGGALSAVAA